ncbi:MAG: signal recognition particle protein [Firmicutes bacterium]|nr:signal recognition particle protein [Candidatus Colimorpha enterica]
MAFQSLTDKLNAAFKRFRSKGKLTEDDVKEGMREIKLALLEADVSYKVVKDFTKKVTERAVGADVLESLLPAQQIVKIVNEELTSLMGGTGERIRLASHPPTVVMMVGLQGAGKTTHCGKLAKLLKDQGRRPLLVACDVYRPAAVKQLEVVGQQLEIPVFQQGTELSPVEIAKNGIEHAKQHGHDVVFIDTAGRLHIDEKMMEELSEIKTAVNPNEILLVVDAMLGQDAVNVADSFNQLLDISGVVLTKLDGDTRGGAALSVRYITGKPIKYVGVGEKLDAIEPFYPDRMASRILGMGDVLSLIEKAETAYDEKQAEELEKKLRTSEFNLEDYLDHFSQIRKMGPMKDILAKVPGIDQSKLENANIDDRMIDRMEAIILSMTPKERKKPSIINPSRKKRIAAGSGMKVEDVNRLLKQFEQTCKMMKEMSSGKYKKMMKKGKFGKMGNFGF